MDATLMEVQTAEVPTAKVRDIPGATRSADAASAVVVSVGTRLGVDRSPRRPWVGRRLRIAAASLFIIGYLTALAGGVAANTFSYGATAHPLMYFLVWDMFCGWSAYESRMRVIGEGVSGQFYTVSPGPWGELRPHGDLGRQHYDASGAHCARMALNTLAHTQHEDLTRLFVVEEVWPKKFNMPDDGWAARWDEPKQRSRYYNLRHVVTPEGAILQTFPDWFSHQGHLVALANPRLAAEYSRSKPFMTLPGLKLSVDEPSPASTFPPGR